MIGLGVETPGFDTVADRSSGVLTFGDFFGGGGGGGGGKPGGFESEGEIVSDSFLTITECSSDFVLNNCFSFGGPKSTEFGDKRCFLPFSPPSSNTSLFVKMGSSSSFPSADKADSFEISSTSSKVEP